MWIIILILAIIFLIAFIRVRKIPKLGNMTLVSGGIKTGKTTLSVYLAIRKYKRNHFVWRAKCVFFHVFKFLRLKKFKDKELPEEPLLYSNIPLAVPYVPLTNFLLCRVERFNYKSVVYVCESSLIADSQMIKNPILNEQLLLFNKLFAHETRGGSIFYDTQSIADCHYSIKRTLSSYLYVHHTFKLCPFFLLMWVREFKYSEDNSVINNVDKDIEEDLKLIIVPKSTWKKFDCYAFSSFTDNLPVVNEKHIAVDMKVRDLVSFKKFLSLKNGGEKDDKI